MLKFGNEKHLGTGSGDDAEWGNIGGTLSNQTDLDAALGGKQSTLVSGTNIKTVNGVSLLGSGDVAIGEGGTIAIDQTYNSESTNAQSGTAVAEGLLTVANKDLSNLSADGQMVIDSANGTISNCILEIPQNIKLTLKNNVLTLKAGSIVTNSGLTYQTVTATQDYTANISSSLADGKYLVFARISDFAMPIFNINQCCSGATDSIEAGIQHIWFDTNTKEVKQVFADSTYAQRSYPICMIEIISGVSSFAKDSNGNDMIFNGAGFIGHHAFVYPNVKVLVGNGLNADGSLKSLNYTTNSLIICELPTYNSSDRALFLESVNYVRQQLNGADVDTLEDLQQSNYYYQYVIKENQYYQYQNNVYNQRNVVKIVDFSNTDTTVTDFAICQPYQGARNLLTDDVDEQIKQNTNDISTKQADLTTVSGYDATKTQTLKNVSGVLTWIDDE